jgi:hypothetical protein
VADLQFRELVNEISAIVDGKVSDVIIKLVINRKYRELCGKIVMDENIVEATANFATTVSIATLNPTLNVSKVIVAKHTSGSAVLDYVPWYLFAQKDRTSTDSVVTTYTMLGNDMYIHPSPNGFTATIDFVYASEPAALSADTDVPKIPDNFHWVLKEGTLLDTLRSIPAKEDPDGRYAQMIPLTEATYLRGVEELLISEGNKGKAHWTARS